MSQGVFRRPAVGAWIALAMLFSGPGRERSASTYVAAFGLAAFITRLGWQRVESRRQIVLFSLAGVVVQLTRGGEAGMTDWAAGTAGAVIGVVIARAITHEK